jgi:hypothetical protein
LKDSEGNEVIIRVMTKDGIITERANVEEMEIVKVEEIPQASGDILDVNKVPEQKNSVESGTQKMAEETDTAEPITEDESAPENEMPTEVDMGKMMDDMSYRIGEMEAKIAKMEEAMYPPVNSEVTEEVAGVKMKEEELPKLDGAPVEEATKFAAQNKNNYGKKVNETPTQKNSVESGTLKMAEQTDTAEPITEDENAPTEEMPTEEVDMGKMMEDMAYRISEMEARLVKCEEAMYPPVNSEVTEEVAGVKMEEEKLPKLDGAPVEEATKFSAQTKNNYGKKVNDSQSNFLAKLYN